MLFLLKDGKGKAIVMAQATTKEDADMFGRRFVPQFCGDSVEIEDESRSQAEEFWGVRTVRVPIKLKKKAKPVATITRVWVRGLELPAEVKEDNLLTEEDLRDLTLDHIARLCPTVIQLEIRKSAC
jgi:hypothetical protein